MIVWVLLRIYCCILLNVIVTNGCLNITKDLLLYFIECNYDEWLYKYYEKSTFILYRMKLSRMVYEYYERSIIVLYWMLIIMDGCMSITRDLLLYCIAH